MKIVISGIATAHDAKTKQPVTPAQMQKLDGVIYDKEECSNYLDNELLDIGITGGTLRIVYVKEKNALRVVTEYAAPRKLKAEELRKLSEFTQGQWSDGMGEHGFDDLAEKSGIQIDPSPAKLDKEVRIEQIDEGTKPASPSEKATAKLLRAVKKGDLEVVREAIDEGADIEAKNAGFQALHLAIGRSHVDIVRFLVEHGADVNSLDLTKGVPLATCALNNTVQDVEAAEMAKILLEHGADANHDERGWTPLDYAINREKVALQEVLRTSGGISKYYSKAKT